MSILHIKQKRKFSVESKEDLNVFSEYIKTSSWGPNGCPFTIEYPWVNVPDMIKDKLVKKHLDIN